MSHPDLAPNPVHPVVDRLVNDDGETYWVKIEMTRLLAGRFLREMWESIDGSCFPQDDEDALGEWTDRIRDVRSTYSSDGICIRTHAWSPEGDRQTLHSGVLRFLRDRGLEV